MTGTNEPSSRASAENAPSSASSDDASLRDYTQQNRRAWNEIAQVRQQLFPPASFFAQGGSTLEPRVIEAARALFGRLDGQRVIHLQCATGEDTLSWSVLGAEALGVDLADEQIVIARRKASEAGLATQFAAADIYDLPSALPAEWQSGCDIVFTGGGAIVWLPELSRWARVIAALLAPGGRLILSDEHPISGILWAENGQIKIEEDYFARDKAAEVRGWGHFDDGGTAQEIKYEFSWPLGDVVTALAQARLIIERLEEFPGGPAFRFGKAQAETMRLPGSYLLIARK